MKTQKRAPVGIAPVYVRLEEWVDGEWVVRLEPVPLMYPDAYAPRLAAHGKIARAVNLDTGEIYGPDTPKAEECLIYCGQVHVGANTDGMCLL